MSRRTGLPVVHLDEHHWKPGWVAPERDEWRRIQQELVAEPRWIIDGNYGGTFDLRFSQADTVIIFALPRMQCILGVLKRRLVHRGQLMQAPGCPDRITLEFLKFVWDYPKVARLRLDAAIEEHGAHLRMIEFDSHRSADAYLRRLGRID